MQAITNNPNNLNHSGKINLNQIELFANLPVSLDPLWRWADSLSVAPEAVLVALEATAASFVNSRTTILGKKSTNYTVGPTMFSAIVGEPGSKKSLIIDRIAIEPLMEMQYEAMGVYQKEYSKYKTELSEWKFSKVQDKGPTPTPPIERQYMTSDYTPEALRDLATRNPRILRVFDKLARKSNSSNYYTAIKGIQPQHLLEGYDGTLPDMYRRGKHYPSLEVNQCLLGGIHPVFLSDLMINHDSNGKFARYNVALLDNRSDYWDEDDDKIIDVTELLVGLYKGIDKLPEQHFYLSKKAYYFFADVHNKLENAVRKEVNPAIIFQYKKGTGKILKWALLYHVVNAVGLNEVPSQEVSHRYIHIAQLRLKYQINQVRALLRIMDDTTSIKLTKVYEIALKKKDLALMTDTTTNKLIRIYEIALKKKDLSITQRDVVTRSKVVKTKEEAIKCFQRLAEMGYGEIVKTPRAIKFVAKPSA